MSELLGLRQLGKVYPGGVLALEDVSLSLFRGETLAVVGESGSGKTTLARLVLGLEAPTSGSIWFREEKLDAHLRSKETRRRIQLVQQDPYSTLNPSKTAGASVELPLIVHHFPDRAARIRELFERVGLSRQWIERYPSELSGGQRQRVALARALAAEPELIVLDEPTSALDVSVQAKILSVLAALQSKLGLTTLFITHDLALIRTIATRVAVIYRGRLVEIGPTDSVFRTPRHRYTQKLLSSIAVVDEKEELLKPGWPEDAPDDRASRVDGCLFRPRCPFSVDRCEEVSPLLPRGGAASPHVSRALCTLSR